MSIHQLGEPLGGPDREPITPLPMLAMCIALANLVVISRALVPIDRYGLAAVMEMALLGVCYYRFGIVSFIPAGIATFGASFLSTFLLNDASYAVSAGIAATNMVMGILINHFVPRAAFDEYFHGFTSQFMRSLKIWIPTYGMGSLAISLVISTEVEITLQIALMQFLILLILPFIVLGPIQCALGLPREIWRTRYMTVGVPVAGVLTVCFLVFWNATQSVYEDMRRELDKEAEIITNNAKDLALDRFARVGQTLTLLAIDSVEGKAFDTLGKHASELLDYTQDIAGVGLVLVDESTKEVVQQRFVARTDGLSKQLVDKVSASIAFEADSPWMMAKNVTDTTGLTSCTGELFFDGYDPAVVSLSRTVTADPAYSAYLMLVADAQQAQQLLFGGFDHARYRIEPSYRERALGNWSPGALESFVELESCQREWYLRITFKEPMTPIDMERASWTLVAALVFLLPVAFALYSDVSRRAITERDNREVMKMNQELSLTKRMLTENQEHTIMGGIASGLTHEMNTPLTTANLALEELETLLDEIEDACTDDACNQPTDATRLIDEAKAAANDTRINLNRVSETVYNMKAMVIDRFRSTAENIRVRRHIEHLVDSMRASYKLRNQSIEVTGDPSLMLYAAPGQLSQIIINLLENTRRHGFPNNEPGAVTIAVSKRDDQCVIDYTDNGRGISDENRAKVFQENFTTAREEGGTGIGLYYSQNIVRTVLLGQMRLLDSKRGVHFQITIPLNQRRHEVDTESRIV